MGYYGRQIALLTRQFKLNATKDFWWSSSSSSFEPLRSVAILDLSSSKWRSSSCPWWSASGEGRADSRLNVWAIVVDDGGWYLIKKDSSCWYLVNKGDLASSYMGQFILYYDSHKSGGTIIWSWTFLKEVKGWGNGHEHWRMSRLADLHL